MYFLSGVRRISYRNRRCLFSTRKFLRAKRRAHFFEYKSNISVKLMRSLEFLRNTVRRRRYLSLRRERLPRRRKVWLAYLAKFDDEIASRVDYRYGYRKAN